MCVCKVWRVVMVVFRQKMLCWKIAGYRWRNIGVVVDKSFWETLILHFFPSPVGNVQSCASTFRSCTGWSFVCRRRHGEEKNKTKNPCFYPGGHKKYYFYPGGRIKLWNVIVTDYNRWSEITVYEHRYAVSVTS